MIRVFLEVIGTWYVALYLIYVLLDFLAALKEAELKVLILILVHDGQPLPAFVGPERAVS